MNDAARIAVQNEHWNKKTSNFCSRADLQSAWVRDIPPSLHCEARTNFFYTASLQRILE